MNIPPGFIVGNDNILFSTSSTKGNSTDHVLKLKKNVYCLCQASKNWFNQLCSSLITYGSLQSLVEPCLFTKSDCIIIIHVNDCLLFVKIEAILDSIITSLQSEFNITPQDDVGAFLSLHIQCTPDVYLELTQPSLISKIISLCG